MILYYDRAGQPISEEQAHALMGDMERKRVAATEDAGTEGDS